MNNELAKAVYAAFEVDPWVNPHRDEITIDCQGGVVTLTGEVAEISAKRRAPLVARDVPGVTTVDDRLTVKPAEAMGDDEILVHLRKMILDDLALAHYDLVTINHKGEAERWRENPEHPGRIVLHAEDGGVYLEGRARSLCDRRLVEVMAWWVPGSRNVVNDLEVVPPEEDNDDQLKEAIVLVLDLDPFVDHEEILFTCRNGEVTLKGRVPVPEQIKLAEHDCWYIDGVRKVENQLELP